jgi:hypothetical protein
VSVFILSGFCAPSPSRAIFLIPYFSLVGTNEVFAQELNEEFYISDFCPFKTDHFEPIQFVPNPVPRRKGHAGVLGVRLMNGSIIFGGIQKIRAQVLQAITSERSLFHSGNSGLNPSFFDVEANEFLKRPKDAAAAIAAVSNRLAPSHRAIWAKIEIGAQAAKRQSGRPTTLRPRSEVTAFHQELLDNGNIPLDDPNFVDRWRLQWLARRQLKNRQQIVSAATAWLSKGELTRDGVAEVIAKCLTSFPDNRLIRDIAVKWISLKDYHSIYWGPIWLSLNDKRSNPLLTEDGFLFLGSTMESADIRSVRVWSRVWRRLRSQIGSSNDVLIRLGERAIPSFKFHKEFVRSVLLPISKEDRRASPMVHSAIVEWLKENFKGTNLWAGIFCGLLANTSKDSELEELGITWLKQYPNINKWKNVWDVIRKKTGASSELVHLGRLWIESAYPDIYIWPDVMSQVLESGDFNPVEVDLAQRWLVAHSDRKDTKSYQRLNDIVALRLVPRATP